MLYNAHDSKHFIVVFCVIPACERGSNTGRLAYLLYGMLEMFARK